MKLKHLFLTLLMTLVGSSAWADTDKLTTENGWSKVTNLSSMTLNDYYFAFVDDSKDLMLSLGDGYEESTDPTYRTPVYLPCENAEMNPNMLWILETNSNGNKENCYSIRNAEYNSLCLQTEWNAAWYCRTHDQGGTNVQWCRWIITLADGKYTLQNGNYPDSGYLGPWDDGKFTNGMEVAGNKSTDNRGYFQIYAIAKSKVDWVNKASLQNPANFTYKITNPDFEKRSTLNGWTNSGTVNFGAQNNDSFTGKSGRRYVENYHGNGTLDINQTLKNMPAGTYKLVAQAQTSGSDGLLYANEKKTSVTTNDSYEVTFTLSEIGDVKIGFKATSNGSAWTGVDNFRLYFYGDISNLTNSIVNNSFEENLTGWTNDGSAKVVAQTNTSFGKTGGKYAELWQPNGTVNIHQVVTNLPAGVYKISARVKARGLSSAKIFANSSEYNLKIEDNEYEYDVYEKLNAEGSIDLGINAVGTGADASWIAFDNFRLMYVGEDFPQVELATDLLYNKDLEVAQTSAQTAFNTNPNGTNYTALVYSTIPAREEKAYEEAQVARTTAALESSSIATDNIDGWRCTNAQAFHVNTWSNEGETDGSNMTKPFIENWTGAGGLLGNGEISYLMVGLTPGEKYNFSALGRAIIEKNASATLTGIKMFANETEIDLTEQGEAKSAGENSLVYGTFTLEGTVNEDGVLAVGFKIADTNCNWLAFKNVKFGKMINLKKTELKEVLDAVVVPTANVGYAAFQYPADEIATINAAKATAQTVYDNADATIEQVEAQITALSGITLPALNVPTAGQRFHLNLKDKGTTTFVANPSAQSGYSVTFNETESNNYSQAFELTPVVGAIENDMYTLSFTDNEGETRYICNGIPYSAGTGAYGIRTITDSEMALVVKLVATATEGEYNLLNTSIDGGYKKLGSNGGDFYTDDKYSIFTISEAAKANVTLAVSDIHWATFVAPFAVDITDMEGLEAYTVTVEEDAVVVADLNGKVIPANTPVLLYKNTNETFKQQLSGYGLATKQYYTEGNLVGNIDVATVIPVTDGKTDYLLQKNDDVVGFYKIDEGNTNNLKVGKNRAYLQVDTPAASRMSFTLEGDKTAIDAIDALTSGKAEIYDLNGRKLNKLQKGINIVNGKKIILK